MKTLLRRPLVRSLFAASITAAALASRPLAASAESSCYSHCYWSCPSDRTFVCRVGGGPNCGFSATCNASDTCGALMIELKCSPVGGEE